MLLETPKFGQGNLWRHPLRTVLATLGVIFGITAVIIVSIPGGLPASAQVGQGLYRPQPSDLMIELLGSSLGAAAGGFGGLLLTIPFLNTLVELDPLGWVNRCERRCHCEGHPYSPCFCQLLCGFTYGPLGVAIGLPVGATVGVAIAGSLIGVEGNVPLALVGSVAGELAGIFLIVPALGLEQDGWLAPSIALLSTGLGATLGYNIGAHMKTEETGELDIPLFEVRW